MEPQRLDVLLKDYELAENQLRESETRIIQVAGLTLPIMGASASTSYLIFQQAQNSDVGRLVAWISPLLFILVYALVIYVIYFKVSHYYHCRILADLINRQVRGNPDEELLFRFKHDRPYNFASFKHGSNYFRTIYVLILTTSLILFGVTFWQSWSFIEQDDASSVPWFFVSYLLAFVLDLIACWGVLIVLPKDYTKEWERLFPEQAVSN